MKTTILIYALMITDAFANPTPNTQLPEIDPAMLPAAIGAGCYALTKIRNMMK